MPSPFGINYARDSRISAAIFSVWSALKSAPNPLPFESTVLMFVKTVGK